MKEYELRDFIIDTSSKFHWETFVLAGDFVENVYLFINTYDISEFQKLLGNIFLTNRDIEVVMKGSYFVFKMAEICEYFGIEMENVFSRE